MNKDNRALPSPFGKQLQLNKADTETFWILQEILLEIETIPSLESAMNAIIASPDDVISFEVKLALAMCHGTSGSVAEWSYRNFREDELRYLVGCRFLSGKRGYQIAHNKNLTWAFLREILLNFDQLVSSRELIVEHLDRSIITEEMAVGILEIRKQSGISVSVAVKPARELYNFDDSIPDEWVERSIVGGDN